MEKFFIDSDAFQLIPTGIGTLPQLVVGGGFSSVPHGITVDRFPVAAPLNRSTELCFAFMTQRTEATTQEVLAWMESEKWAPARFDELLALACLFPGLKVTRYLRALGSCCTDEAGITLVPGCWLGTFRSLTLFPVQEEPSWSANSDCFPCFRV
jgi:hypothetical protein